MRILYQGPPELEGEVFALVENICRVLGARPETSLIVVLGDSPLRRLGQKGFSAGMAYRSLVAIYVYLFLDWQDTLVHEVAHILKPHLQEREIRALVPKVLTWVKWEEMSRLDKPLSFN